MALSEDLHMWGTLVSNMAEQNDIQGKSRVDSFICGDPDQIAMADPYSIAVPLCP